MSRLRREYAGQGLAESDLDSDPLVDLGHWLRTAISAGVHEPNAMVLATSSADAVPSARLVLLKGLDERGLTFFTNYGSRKAAELDANPHCALVLPWHALDRQVRVEGVAERVSRAATSAYFSARPREAQLGAWASPQSQVVPDRDFLERRYAECVERWPADTPVPTPDGWGGYRVLPFTVELWQGRPGRLHDRLRYRRSGEGWTVERLAP